MDLAPPSRVCHSIGHVALRPRRWHAEPGIPGVVRMLGEDEVKSLLAEQGHVELTCEFCNRTFRYDEQAAQTILRGGVKSSVLH